MEQSFSYQQNAVLGMDSSIEEMKRLGAADINIVLRAEALKSAEYLKEKFGTPYVYGIPYGYEGTMQWLKEIASCLNSPIAPKILAILKSKMMQSAGYKMYASMYSKKEHKPNAVLIGDYDQIKGFSGLFREINLPVSLKIINHSLSDLEAEDMIRPKEEKEKIEYLKKVEYSLVFGDDISLYLCSDTCEKMTVSFPLINHAQIANHLPFVGIRGMDAILEVVERYYGRL